MSSKVYRFPSLMRKQNETKLTQSTMALYHRYDELNTVKDTADEDVDQTQMNPS